MKKLSFISTIVLLTSCQPHIAGDPIDVDSVDSVLFSQRHHSNIQDTTKRLKASTIKLFADKWNSSSTDGPRKFLPQYVLTIYFKDGKPKKYIISSKYVKEKNDWCLDFQDTAYFDKIWSDKNASH
jgi:hypothetical protein